MTAHAKFSPSASKRWIECAGSMNLIATLPPTPEVQSPYADEGVRAHECLEAILKAGPDKVRTAAAGLRKTYGAEMTEHALSCARMIMAAKPKGAQLFAETKSDLAFIDPHLWGTADCVLAEDFGRLYVIDLKYGAGIPVDPEHNTQLMIYGLGIAHKFDYNFSEVVLVILQPRVDHARGIWREWRMPMEDLIAWADTELRPAVAACKNPTARLNAGEWCRFCPAAHMCPEISTKAMRQAQIVFDDEDLPTVMPPPQSIPPDVLGDALTAIDNLDTWIAAVRSHAYGVIERGVAIPGWKLVAKVARRKWADEHAASVMAREQYGNKAFTAPELLSPAQCEKVCGKDFVAEYSVAVSSGSTLVPESDRRPALNRIESAFPDCPVLSDNKNELATLPKKRKSK